MKQAVKIKSEESNAVERLFLKYTSYMNMLDYLAANSSRDTDLYNAKWEDASDMWILLNKVKTELAEKYQPEGEWERYEFDFEHQEMIFTDGA